MQNSGLQMFINNNSSSTVYLQQTTPISTSSIEMLGQPSPGLDLGVPHHSAVTHKVCSVARRYKISSTSFDTV